jgi:hypothetical protein
VVQQHEIDKYTFIACLIGTLKNRAVVPDLWAVQTGGRECRVILKEPKHHSKCPENSDNFTASLALQPALGFLQ